MTARPAGSSATRDKGLRAMFTMMNEARLGVGIQGVALSEVAYQNAAAYARERRQGRALSGAKEPAASADPILVHPDVRRTLAAIKGFNIAARALVLSTALAADIAHRSPDPAERQAADDRVGLLTPVIKGVLTDRGFDNAVAAQQVFGGHGYIAEHGMEQFVRDARIAMLYEGTNGIQALDLVGRKLAKDGGTGDPGLFRGGRRVRPRARRCEPCPLRRSARGRARRSREGDQLVHAQRHGQTGKRRRRRHRLHAPLRPGGPRPHVGEDRRRRCPGSGSRHRSRFRRTRPPRNGASPRPHHRRRRWTDGDSGGGVLEIAIPRSG